MLRKMREAAGLTREQLLSRMENCVSLATWTRWELEGAEPTLTRRGWALFCRAVGMEFNELPDRLGEWAKLS